MSTRLNLALAVFLVFGISNVNASEQSIQQSFINSLAKHLPEGERSEWSAYVAREGIQSITENYYAFGSGACNAILQGAPEQALIENYAGFFGGVRAKAIVKAAIEVICPKAQK